MKRARVYVDGHQAGLLEDAGDGTFIFRYLEEYAGPPVSLNMPLTCRTYEFNGFPPFFEGLLPEGDMLEGLLRLRKIDRSDLFAQIVAVGRDTVGAVTVLEEPT